MRKSTSRVALVSSALLALGVMSAGVVSAAPAQPGSAQASAPAKPGPGPFDKIMRHVVHGTVVVEKKDGTFVTLQFDRGTIASIGAGTLTISEAGGRTETVATNADTRVRKNGVKSDLSRLAVGDKVAVVSELRGSTPVAKMILVPRPRPTQLPAPTN